MIKGTEHFHTYPDTKPSDPMRRYKGITSYGFIKYKGQSVLKVPSRNVRQLVSVGYHHVGSGTHYAYVTRP